MKQIEDDDRKSHKHGAQQYRREAIHDIQMKERTNIMINKRITPHSPSGNKSTGQARTNQARERHAPRSEKTIWSECTAHMQRLPSIQKLWSECTAHMHMLQTPCSNIERERGPESQQGSPATAYASFASRTPQWKKTTWKLSAH